MRRSELISTKAINPNDVLSLRAVYHYNVFSKFPLGGSASYDELAAKCGVNTIDLRRLLRHAMTNHIFQEKEGRVEHTAATRVLLENEMIRNIMGIMTEEMFQGAGRVGSAFPLTYLAYIDRRSML